MHSQLDDIEEMESKKIDDASSTQTSSSSERLAAIPPGGKKRGRHPRGCDCGRCVQSGGGKSSDGVAKTKPEAEKKRFAGVVIAFFSILGFVLKRFGYEYSPKLTLEEAEEGAMHLLPIADKLGFLVTVANVLGFPIWAITKIGEKFRRKLEPRVTPPTLVPGVVPPLADGIVAANPPSDSPGDSTVLIVNQGPKVEA